MEVLVRTWKSKARALKSGGCGGGAQNQLTAPPHSPWRGSTSSIQRHLGGGGDPRPHDHWKTSFLPGLEVTFGLRVEVVGKGHSCFLGMVNVSKYWELEILGQKSLDHGLGHLSEGQVNWFQIQPTRSPF